MIVHVEDKLIDGICIMDARIAVIDILPVADDPINDNKTVIPRDRTL